MEAEIVGIIISCILSGSIILWKFIKRLRNSSCMINTGNTKIEFSLGDIEKVIDEVNKEEKELSEEEKEKLKKVLSKMFKK